ncbi:MAG: SAM-dependent DNA methyltransferase [Oscillibacter sp.]|nr:SAM-dependent DNA methyltransferase [Oscillibacter sp.]
MNTQEIVSKLWNLCNVLRDDGITYHQYVTELTYILFLKMSAETNAEERFSKGVTLLSGEKLTPKQKTENAEKEMVLSYSWNVLRDKNGLDQYEYYKTMLRLFGTYCTGRVREIYQGAATNIDEPKNLAKIINSIDSLDWFSAREEGLGNLYEGLLEWNAGEKKSGAGQYFTPRPLVDVMTRLMKPQPGERCNDPACGTFGFMIAASQYVKDRTDDFFSLPAEQAAFERGEAFTGCELVHDTHRLALMNAMLHDMQGQIILGDTLSETGKSMKGYDLVLTNPPFGTKKGGERAARDDFTYTTSNKQLNFLQHIYRSLNTSGKARAAVVLPDNVLFADGDGEKILVDLMEKCKLHTVLRLPTGIFYAQGVKTNVLFFTRGPSDRGNTKEVWFYDLRTNMPALGKTNPLKAEHFSDFEAAYTAPDRRAVQDERFSVLTREEIAAHGNSLDLGLIRDESIVDYEDLPDPVASGEAAIAKLAEAMSLLQSVVDELKALESTPPPCSRISAAP